MANQTDIKIEIDTVRSVFNQFNQRASGSMKRVTPNYPRHIVNKAGRTLLSASIDRDNISDQELEIISNWRSAHSFPLNTLKLWLVNKSQQVDQRCLVAQRLKRLSSISDKLARYPEMKLTQMQDVGGCRAILSTVRDVNALVGMYKRSEIRHKLVHEDDYISSPKDSGYRGVHLVYSYQSDRNTDFNGLKIEVQIRSRLQHAWATAVETVGTFSQQALKSSQGQEEWLRFFALMGSAIAQRERRPPVPGTPVFNKELQDEIRFYVRHLEVTKRLRLYAESLKIPEEKGTPSNAKYFLLELDPSEMRIRITGYKSEQLEKASADYLSVEQKMMSKDSFGDAVLVSVDSLATLKKAYPNYFLDTDRFIELVKSVVDGHRRIRNPNQMTLPFPLPPIALV